MLYGFYQWVLSWLPECMLEPQQPAAGKRKQKAGASESTTESVTAPTSTTTSSGTAGTTPPDETARDTSRGTAGQDYNGSGKVKKKKPPKEIVEIVIDFPPKGKDHGRGGRE